MKEIQEVVAAKVKEMIEGGKIQEVIEKNVAAAIESAIEDQFRSYGGITKSIGTAIKEGLRINVEDLPFETYNAQMLVAVKGKLGQLFKGAASERFMEEMDKVLAPAPKEMTAVELVEAIVKLWKTDDYDEAQDIGEYAEVEVEDTTYGGVRFEICKGNGDKVDLYISSGKILISYRQHFNPTSFSAHEAFIFKLYAAGTKITGLDGFNPSDCELRLHDFD